MTDNNFWHIQITVDIKTEMLFSSVSYYYMYMRKNVVNKDFQPLVIQDHV